MANLNFRHSALASITALSLMTLPLQAQAAWDYSTIPLLGTLIALVMGPTAKPAAQPAPPPVAYSVNQANTTVWSVPQPSVGYTYVNGQAQRVYNVYTPQSPVQIYSVPANYPVLQQTNPQAAQQIQTQAGVVQPNQTAQWQYQVSPVAYQQTVPNAPQLNGTNMANTPINTSANTQINTSASTNSTTSNNTRRPTPTSLNDTRMVDTNASGGYKWPVATNSSGTEGYVSSVYGRRDRTNFIKGCSDGTAPAAQCEIRMHNGIDLSVPHGTRVESVTSGKVVYVDPYCKNPESRLAFNKNPATVKPAGGCTVSVLNSNNEIVTYQHLSDPGNLKAGDTIAAGDAIGKSGNSGGSFGAHLDFAICSISPEKAAAAQKANADMSRCSAIGGKTVNPLDRLDPKDPRTVNARAKEKINKDYLACKEKAGKSLFETTKCKIIFHLGYNKKPAAPKAAAKPMESLTGKLNMGRI